HALGKSPGPLGLLDGLLGGPELTLHNGDNGPDDSKGGGPNQESQAGTAAGAHSELLSGDDADAEHQRGDGAEQHADDDGKAERGDQALPGAFPGGGADQATAHRAADRQDAPAEP